MVRGKWSDRNYAEIPRGVVFRAFVERIRELMIFSRIVDRPNQPHDFTLAVRFDRMQRKPISSPDDLWTESSVDLIEEKHGQTLWSTHLAFPIEARDLEPRTESGGILYTLIAKLAAIKLASRTAIELNRFLARGGDAKLAEAISPDCSARTEMHLELTGIPPDDENAILEVLSESPCYALERAGQDSLNSRPGPDLVLTARRGSDGRVTLAIRTWETRFELYRGGWPEGSGKDRDITLHHVLEEITAYHHRHGECVHYRYASSHTNR